MPPVEQAKKYHITKAFKASTPRQIAPPLMVMNFPGLRTFSQLALAISRLSKQPTL
jgi:hypothetical protein